VKATWASSLPDIAMRACSIEPLLARPPLSGGTGIGAGTNAVPSKRLRRIDLRPPLDPSSHATAGRLSLCMAMPIASLPDRKLARPLLT
jgi:hypothetical protein